MKELIKAHNTRLINEMPEMKGKICFVHGSMPYTEMEAAFSEYFKGYAELTPDQKVKFDGQFRLYQLQSIGSFSGNLQIGDDWVHVVHIDSKQCRDFASFTRHEKPETLNFPQFPEEMFLDWAVFHEEAHAIYWANPMRSMPIPGKDLENATEAHADIYAAIRMMRKYGEQGRRFVEHMVACNTLSSLERTDYTHFTAPALQTFLNKIDSGEINFTELATKPTHQLCFAALYPNAYDFSLTTEEMGKLLEYKETYESTMRKSMHQFGCIHEKLLLEMQEQGLNQYVQMYINAIESYEFPDSRLNLLFKELRAVDNPQPSTQDYSL